jgi:putative tryptophan/tyrosine transport system substrate-binding protein
MKQRSMQTIVLQLFLITLIIGLTSLAVASDVKKVILIETMPVPAVLENSRWFQFQLKELGYEQNKNLKLTILKANGDIQLAEKLLNDELAGGNPDLVVTIATLASQTAAKLLKDTDVPVLFFQVSDPIGAGLVKQMNAPTGTNITGKVNTVNRNAKIEMLFQLVSQIAVHRPIRFGIIHSTYPSSMGDIRELKMIAKRRGDITFVPYEVEYKKVPAGLSAMIEGTKKGIKALQGKVDFWMEPLGPLGESFEYTQAIMEFSTTPIVLGAKADSVKRGALMHVTPNIEASGRETALLASQILEGKDPGTIPVTPPLNFDLGINITTALKLKIVIPPDILKLAGKHVYR